MEGRMDRRQLRTKNLLLKTLLELIEEKGQDAITVTDIANRAEINRGTFYLHYRDVPDMLHQIKEERFDKLSKVVSQMDIMDLLSHANRGEIYPISLLVFEEVSCNADFYRVFMGSNGDLSYVHRFREFMESHIYKKLNYYMKDKDSLVPQDYIITYMSSANLGVMMHWLMSGMKQTPLEMARLMTQLVTKGPLMSMGIVEDMSGQPSK